MKSTNTYHAAIDLGASSGRIVLGCLEDETIKLQEIHRFENSQISINGHYCWNLENIKSEISRGLSKCKKSGYVPSTIGIDTWGVDFVLLDSDDKILGNCVAYRDDRTAGMLEVAEGIIPFSKAYSRTGIQKLEFNTIYQLLAVKSENPEHLAQAENFLMVPDYLNFFLTGKKINEYTNATTTGLVNLESGEWDLEIIDACGFPSKIFNKLTMPGNAIGKLRDEIVDEIGFSADVVLPATHDTGSAYLSVPARDEKSVYLSSGTWSLLGVETKIPFSSDEALAQNFTNEGGFDKRFRFLRNIMGLWLIQSVRRELNGVEYFENDTDNDEADSKQSELEDKDIEFIDSLKKEDGQPYEFAELSLLADEARDYYAEIDVNDKRFLAPASMITEIRKAAGDAGYKPPSTVGEIMRCIYINLAKCYRSAIEGLQHISGVDYKSLNIVGGGCQDSYFNQVIADICGIDVYSGPIEATCIGNLLVQMICAGEIANIDEGRKIITSSFDVKKYSSN